MGADVKLDAGVDLGSLGGTSGAAGSSPAIAPESAESCLQQCVEALGASDTERALAAARRMRDLAPSDARAWHLVGAIHAELGLHARAAGDFERAVELAPDSRAARFQLGLLRLVHFADTARAREVWRPLAEGDAPDALAWFAQGLLLVADGELARGAETLERGIATNDLDASLSADMRRIADAARAQLGGGAGPQPHAASLETPAQRLLEAYRRNQEVRSQGDDAG